MPLYDLLRYHLGFVNASFAPERSDPGKRVRPRLCAMACEAVGGDPRQAVPTAAAVELLHNFTLVHDDIQDQSPLRRHRETIWQRWGTAQAINAGDAMFVVAHLALARSVDAGLSPETVLQLSTLLHQTTLRIVEGQVLDLGFESRVDVTADEYLRMIGGKTAEICRCACRSGALIGGADERTRQLFGELGLAIGLGFQLQDDLLGIWGTTQQTGKAEADDIRRRKKSYPVLVLHERIQPHDRAELAGIYAADDVTPKDIRRVLELLTRYEVRENVEQLVEHWHDRASELLDDVVVDPAARAPLAGLIAALARRSG